MNSALIALLLTVAFCCLSMRQGNASPSRWYHRFSERNDRDDKSSPPNKEISFRKIRKQNWKDAFRMTSQHETLEDTGVEVTVDDGKSKIRRVAHHIGGYPVWNSGATLIEKTDGIWEVRPASDFHGPNRDIASKFDRKLHGKKVPDESGSISPCQAYAAESIVANFAGRVKTRYIYDLEKSNDVTYADLVEVRGQSANGAPIVHVCLVDARSGEVLENWNGIQDGYKAGNGRVGPYYYDDSSKPKLAVSQWPTDSTSCVMASSDGLIQVFNLNNSTNDISGLDVFASMASKFNCEAGPNDGNSRSYGPMADTFNYAVKTANMFQDQRFGNMTLAQLKAFTPSGKWKYATHFSKAYENAFWDGYAFYFGDGATSFYAFGSGEDVVAHETSHALTESTSGLMYSGEPGCLNEAFSDIMSEMTEYYTDNSTQFLIGEDVMVSGYLRDMKKKVTYGCFFPRPSRTCCTGTKAYCQDPHLCSAIPNYAFYRLATTTGWNTRTAGQAFLLANRLFWRPATTIRQAGCGVAAAVKQAKINNGDINAVFAAWAAIGVSISASYCGISTTTVAAAQQFQPSLAAVSNPSEDVAQRLENCQTLTGIDASTGDSLYFIVSVPKGATYQNVQISSKKGDADLYRSDEWVTGPIKESGVDYWIMLYASESYTNLELKACYY